MTDRLSGRALGAWRETPSRGPASRPALGLKRPELPLDDRDWPLAFTLFSPISANADWFRLERQAGRPDPGREFHTRLLAAVVLAAVVLATALPVAAQTATEPGAGEKAEAAPSTLRDSIVVTAHRLATEAEEVGSSVTVITAEEIELRGAATVAEVLRTVPGLEVVRGGGPGQVTSVFLRGGSSSHTLVLLDGVRLNGPATGAFDFADLTTDLVERIEIVRGPQGTLYGSEAMAGVISITSKKGGAPGLRLAGLGEAGELDSRRWRLGIDGRRGRFDYAVAVSDARTDGVSAAALPGRGEDDPWENTSAAARLGLALAGGRVDLNLRSFDSTVANDGFDFLAGPVDDLDRLQERRGLTGSLALRQELGARWAQSFLIGLYDEELAGSDPDDLFSNFEVRSRRLELGAQSDVALSAEDTLSFGFAYEERQAESVGSFDQKVDLASVYVQHVRSFGRRLHTTAGLRYDRHSQFGGETTWRLAASFEPRPATRIHTSFGSGFKAPTLNDLFFPFFSNPDLEAETSRGFDLGIEQRLLADRLRFDVTWFDTDFDDLIAFDFTTFTPQNLARATSRGLEVTLRYRPRPGFELAASHTWNDTEDLATGQPLPRRPEGRSTLELFYRPTGRLGAAATWIAVRGRIDSDLGPMDDYQRLDLTLRYRLFERPASRAFEPYLRVTNLFDEEYEEIPGFTTPGRVALVGFRFEL